MVNNNIQGAIPLAGRGHSFKSRGDHEPGEYAALINAEITNEGTIKSRRPIIHYSFSGIDYQENSQGFVGVIQDCIIYASATTQQWDTGLATWNPSDLPVSGAAPSYHRIVGAFEYNDTAYWITQQRDVTADTTKFFIYDYAGLGTSPLGSIIFGALTDTEVLSFDHYVEYNGFLIQGDRLWLNLSEGIYFSKATDPTIFAVPDGGFFRFPGDLLTDFVSLGDTIYVFCDSNVHVITYTSDPNTDAAVRRISDIGAYSGAVYGSGVYFVNEQGLYSVTNANVEKMQDLPQGYFFNGQYPHYNMKLVSFANYLVLLYRDITVYEESGRVAKAYGQYGYKWGYDYADPGSDVDAIIYPTLNLFYFNMDNGAVHAVYLKDATDLDTDLQGRVVDIHVSPNGILWLMTNRFVSLNTAPDPDTLTYRSSVYYQEPGYDIDWHYDQIQLGDLSRIEVKPNIIIELRGYTPDGNRYLMKKFRSLEIEGYFPEEFYKINFSYDRQREYDDANASWLTYEGAEDYVAGNDPRQFNPARFGLNQRARAINVRISSDDPFADEQYDGIEHYYQYALNLLEISDIRVLWTYLQRGVESKSRTTYPS